MITILDNVIPEEIYKPFSELVHRVPMHYVYKNPPGVIEPRGHLTIEFSKSDYKSKVNNEHQLVSPVKEVWEHIKSNLRNKELITCYMNGHTYGLDGYYHVDAREPNQDLTKYNYTTFILYVNEEWKADWGGETVFLNEAREIAMAVLPKRNRGVLFESRIEHAPRQCTRIFQGIRKTVVFRTRGERDEDPSGKIVQA